MFLKRDTGAKLISRLQLSWQKKGFPRRGTCALLTKASATYIIHFTKFFLILDNWYVFQACYIFGNG